MVYGSSLYEVAYKYYDNLTYWDTYSFLVVTLLQFWMFIKDFDYYTIISFIVSSIKLLAVLTKMRKLHSNSCDTKISN